VSYNKRNLYGNFPNLGKNKAGNESNFVLKKVGLTGRVFNYGQLKWAVFTLGRRRLIRVSVNPGPVKRGSTVIETTLTITHIDLKTDHLIVFTVNTRLTDYMSQMSDEGGRGEHGGLVSNRKFVVHSKTFVLLVTHHWNHCQ
jgi:hypothetical protein